MRGYLEVSWGEEDWEREFYCAECGHRGFRHAFYCARRDGVPADELRPWPGRLFWTWGHRRSADPEWRESSSLDLKAVCDGIRARYRNHPDHPIWALVEPPEA